jgi:hypothetical protein
MNTVNTYNYESFLLDFAEGRLSTKEINDLFDFLAAHPEFKEDFEAVLEIPLLQDNQANLFSRKTALLKNESLDRIQDLVIAAVEHVALPRELNELKQLEVNNPIINRELEIFAKLKFFEDPNVYFSKKGGLYKSPLVTFSTWMYRVSAVAAAVVFIFTIHFLNTVENGNYKAQADRRLKALQNRTDFKQQLNRDLPLFVEHKKTQKLPTNAKDAPAKGISANKSVPIIDFHSPSQDLAINGDTVSGQNIWMVMQPVNANQLEIPSTGSLASFTSSNPPASQVNVSNNDFKSLILEESKIINSSYNLAGDVSARVKSFAGEFNKYNEVELNVFGVHATIHKPSWMNWSRHLVKS